jgi:formylglycine-generating enzyme required for sulfatase activity
MDRFRVPSFALEILMSFFYLFDVHWICARGLSVAVGTLATVASMAAPSFGGTVTSFGTGANQFQMEFVTIGSPGNVADTTGAPNSAGRVNYTYDIGKFEVSRAMVTAYNAHTGVVAITLADMTSAGGNGANRPATGITWNEAARFVNWLNTSTGGFAAYNYAADSTITTNLIPWTASDTLDYDASNPYRSKRAKYFLPSYNEWYKAAYYNPSNSTYYDFANGSNIRPTAVTGGLSGAVYTQSGEAAPTSPADVTNAGGLSPYGVMGLEGNVMEWEESSVDLLNSLGSSNRGRRGGSWSFTSTSLSSSTRSNNNPNLDQHLNGFRVASLSSVAPAAVPEPSMMLIGTVIGLGGLIAKRRMKK